VKLEHLKPGGGYYAKERPFHCLQPQLQIASTIENAKVNAVDANVTGIMAAGLKEIDSKTHFTEHDLSGVLKTAERLSTKLG
jgi:hypothetical protein